jgi:AraC family transcriptional activator of pobA
MTKVKNKRMKPPPPEIRVLHTVTDYARFCGLPALAHPLLTVIDLEQNRGNVLPDKLTPVVQHFYSVWLKKNLRGKVHYGRLPVFGAVAFRLSYEACV